MKKHLALATIALVGCVAGYAISQSTPTLGGKPSVNKSVITASRFVLTNDDGKRVAELSCLENEPIFILRGSKGENKVWIRVNNGKASIKLFRKDGTSKEITE